MTSTLASEPQGRSGLGPRTSDLDTPRPITVKRAGLVDYTTAWAEQRRLHDAVLAGTEPDTVLLLEHPSVYTAGKRTEPFDRPMDGTPVVDVDRGGKITWHGPGHVILPPRSTSTTGVPSMGRSKGSVRLPAV